MCYHVCVGALHEQEIKWSQSYVQHSGQNGLSFRQDCIKIEIVFDLFILETKFTVKIGSNFYEKKDLYKFKLLI